MKFHYLIYLLIFGLFSGGCSSLLFTHDSENARLEELAEREREAREAAEELRRLQIERGYRERSITLGMDMRDVRSIWGEPGNIEWAGDPSNGNQRWTYYEGLSSAWSASNARIVYFENGRIIGWETR